MIRNLKKICILDVTKQGPGIVTIRRSGDLGDSRTGEAWSRALPRDATREEADTRAWPAGSAQDLFESRMASRAGLD